MDDLICHKVSPFRTKIPAKLLATKLFSSTRVALPFEKQAEAAHNQSCTLNRRGHKFPLEYHLHPLHFLPKTQTKLKQPQTQAQKTILLKSYTYPTTGPKNCSQIRARQLPPSFPLFLEFTSCYVPPLPRSCQRMADRDRNEIVCKLICPGADNETAHTRARVYTCEYTTRQYGGQALPAAESGYRDHTPTTEHAIVPGRWRRTIKIYCRITASIRFALARNCVPRALHGQFGARRAL